MFSNILITLFIGCLAGVFTGLTPGVHVNLVSIILLSISPALIPEFGAVPLAVFVIAMGVTHTFLDALPSIFLGAPDAEQALNVLPGHKMLLEGKGYEAVKLTVIGSFLCLILTIAIMPMMIPILPAIYSIISPFMGYLLLAVVLFMILKTKGLVKKFWSAFLFLISGVLGIIVLSTPNMSQPLFPMLSGMFGISTLLLSLNEKVKMPEQKITEDAPLERKKVFKALGAAVFAGSLTGIMPGLGAAQAAIIALQMVGDIGMHTFLVLVGGINTVNFVFSIATLYAIEKARNGAIIVVQQLVPAVGWDELSMFIASALLAGSIAAFMALKLAKIFARVIGKINYRFMCLSVIVFVTSLVFFFSGTMGLFVLSVSTCVGLIAPLVGVGRNNAMGCLMLPVILFFLV